MTVTLGKALNKMMKEFGIEKTIRREQALFIWDKIVGENISKHTTPEKVSYGKIYIKVDSPSWRSELSFRKDEILKKLNKKLKNAKIKDIVLR